MCRLIAWLVVIAKIYPQLKLGNKKFFIWPSSPFPPLDILSILQNPNPSKRDMEVDDFTSWGSRGGCYGGGAEERRGESGEEEALVLRAHGQTRGTGVGDHRLGVLIIPPELEKHYLIDVNIMKLDDTPRIAAGIVARTNWIY